MTVTEDQLWNRLFASEELPFGRARTAEVEEVIRHADAQGLANLRYTARVLSIRAYGYGGEPAKAFVPFAWCLAAYDRGEGDPRIDSHLFWSFKSIVDKLASFPEVSLAQTMAVLDEMEQRYRRAGYSMNPVHQHRELVARHIGDRAEADEQYRLWCASPRSEMSDCIGCEPSAKADHLSWTGRDEEAVAVAQPVLGGEFTCLEQPQRILTSLLLPYLRTGRLTEAAEAHRRAYRAIQHNRAELAGVSGHVRFCGLTGNHARGVELVERHLGWLDEPPTPAADMDFCAAAAFVLGLVVRAGHGDAVVRRPAAGDRPVREQTVAALHEELSARATGLAALFDARNGTAEQGERVRATLAEEPLVDHLPLSGPARAARQPAAAGPARAAYPDSPEELADLAEREFWLDNDEIAADVWRRFDEVCPDPPPALHARRLNGQGGALALTDLAAAEEPWQRAVELYSQVGDEVGAEETRSRLAMARCLGDRAEDGLAQLSTSVERLARLGSEAAHLRGRMRLASAYAQLDRLAEARALLVEIGPRAEALGETIVSANVAIRTADVTARMGDVDEALIHAERAVHRFERIAPTSNVLCKAQFVVGNLHAARGELDAAYEVLGSAATCADALLRAAALATRGEVAMNLDRAAEAYEHFTGAVTAFVEAGQENAPQAAHAKINLAGTALIVDRPDAAADALEEALPLVEDPEERARARYLLARAYHRLGQHEPALTLLDQVVVHCTADGNAAGVAQMQELAGDILDELDRDAAAALRYVAAADAARVAGLPLEELANRRCAALSWHWADDAERALGELTAADALVARAPADRPPFDEPVYAWQRARLDYDAARILGSRDDPAAALGRATAAAVGFRSLDHEAEAVVADVLTARLLLDLDRAAEAEPLLAAALAALPSESVEQREQVEQLLAQIHG